MDNKLCKQCNIEKSINEFYRDITHKDGLDSQCKLCAENIKKEIRQKTNYQVIKQDKKCSKCFNIKPYTEYNKDKYNIDGLYPYCKFCRKTNSKNYYEDNKDTIILKVKMYYKNNKEILTPKRSEYSRIKAQSNIKFRLARRLRNRLYYALQKKSWKKHTKFSQYIGCTLDQLKLHLETQFKDGMSWDNYGKWHIDHIIPISSANTEQELYKLCHYTNLQPLWAEDNLKKGDKT